MGPSGIDEVIYGEEVFFDKSLWKRHKPLVEKEVLRWRKHIDKISAVHVVTKSELDEMHQYLKIPKDKMIIIPHGVNHDIFKPAENKLKTRKAILEKFDLPDQSYFIHISEINYARKNLFRILDAFKKAREQKIPQKLILVGKALPLISKKIKECKDVIQLGFVPEDDLISLIQGSDAMILPSIHEGFGLPLLEAMACGIPSITMNKHAPPEVVGDSGLLVDPYSVDDIAMKMVEINKNNILKPKSARAYELSQKYSWEKHATQILALYSKFSSTSKDWNFYNSFELAAYRTLATIVSLFAEEKKDILSQSMLNFDYQKMIQWSIEYGLVMPQTKEFLLPFKDWLLSKNIEYNQYEPNKPK